MENSNNDLKSQLENFTLSLGGLVGVLENMAEGAKDKMDDKAKAQFEKGMKDIKENSDKLSNVQSEILKNFKQM